jgi:adenine deaminase
VAEKGNLLVELPRTIFPDWAVNTVKLARRMRPEDFYIPYSGSKSKVRALVIDIRRYSTEFIKIPQVREMDVRGGQVMASVEKDLLKIAVVERHQQSGNIGLGLIEGFGLKAGAVASSVSHDHHNIVVIGASDEDMAAAVNALADLQGGFIAVLDGKVLASVPLQFGGLMSIEPYEQAVKKLNQLDLVVKEKLGCPLSDPIMMLLGISLPTIPEIGISDLGVTQISGLDRRPHVVKVIVED